MFSKFSLSFKENFEIGRGINQFHEISYSNHSKLFSGGGGINMDWLDGMTGCGGECNLGGSSVRFSNFYTF